MDIFNFLKEIKGILYHRLDNGVLDLNFDRYDAIDIINCIKSNGILDTNLDELLASNNSFITEEPFQDMIKDLLERSLVKAISAIVDEEYLEVETPDLPLNLKRVKEKYLSLNDVAKGFVKPEFDIPILVMKDINIDTEEISNKLNDLINYNRVEDFISIIKEVEAISYLLNNTEVKSYRTNTISDLDGILINYNKISQIYTLMNSLRAFTINKPEKINFDNLIDNLNTVINLHVYKKTVNRSIELLNSIFKNMDFTDFVNWSNRLDRYYNSQG